MFLAWLFETSASSEDEHRVVEEEDRREPSTGPRHRPAASRSGMGVYQGLGTRGPGSSRRTDPKGRPRLRALTARRCSHPDKGWEHRLDRGKVQSRLVAFRVEVCDVFDPSA
jgi:hypothetical protein